jgi:hypothetical protein
MSRIEELEVENARLRAALARAGVPDLPAADLPSPAQCAALIERVIAKYPALAHRDIPKELYAAQFERAMRWAAFAGRSDKANSKYAVSFWVDECRAWLAKAGFPPEMLFAPFIAPLIVSGILFESFDQPSAVNLGLTLGGTGRPSTAWRASLEAIPNPVEPYRPRPRHLPTQLNIVEANR